MCKMFWSSWIEKLALKRCIESFVKIGQAVFKLKGKLKSVTLYVQTDCLHSHYTPVWICILMRDNNCAATWKQHKGLCLKPNTSSLLSLPVRDEITAIRYVWMGIYMNVIMISKGTSGEGKRLQSGSQPCMEFLQQNKSRQVIMLSGKG